MNNKSLQKDQIAIGDYAMVSEAVAIEAVESAFKAYDNGKGVWPQMKVIERIHAVKKFAAAMKAKVIV